MICLVLLITVSTVFAGWGTYHPTRLFSLYQTQSTDNIYLAFCPQIQQPQCIPLQYEYQIENSSYLLHDGRHIMHKYIVYKNTTLVISTLIVDQSLKVNIEIQNPTETKVYIHTKCNVYIPEVSSPVCIKNSSQLYSCVSQYESTIISISILNNDTLEEFNRKWDQYSSLFDLKLNHFMTHYKISSEFKDIVTFAISNTFGKFSIRMSKYSHYFALTDSRTGEIDIKMSALILEAISYFDYELAYSIWNTTIEYLEDEVLYSDQSLFNLPLVEHTEIFLHFKHEKGIKILNRFIFVVLFRNINKFIHKEQNYASRKQVHPLNRLMLQINWVGDLQSIKDSIYAESFFEDLYLNSALETPELSVSKISWLLKTLKILIKLNQINNQIPHIQLTSLNELLIDFFYRQCFQKTYKIFRSIHKNPQGKRYFNVYLSYDNMMPFVYEIFGRDHQGYANTLKMIVNLTCQYGIASMQKCPAVDLSFKYRGNVSPYLNYKIVQMINKFDEEKLIDTFSKYFDDQAQKNKIKEVVAFMKIQQHQFLATLKDLLVTKIRNDWDQHKKLFGRWTPLGIPLQSQSPLILVNCLLLAE